MGAAFVISKVSNNVFSFFYFQCDSEGEDDKVSIKPECYLWLVMVLWEYR
jgi:hypothetical protein